MGIEFTLIQMIPLLLILATGVSLWKKQWKIAIVVLALVIVSLVAMPIKVTQKNMSRFEDTAKFDNVPEKVIVKQESFDAYQDSKYTELKADSETKVTKIKELNNEK